MTQQLYNLFHKVFTIDYDEKKLNPRVYSGEQFILTIKVFLAILKAKNIDFWKESIGQPSWHYQLHPDEGPSGAKSENRESYYKVGDITRNMASSVARSQKDYTKEVMRYDGNPTFENIFYEKQEIDEEGKKYWNVEHIAEGNEMPIHISFDIICDYMNKVHGTSFTVDDYRNCDGWLWDEFPDKDENDTCQYLALMCYFHEWIDRFAHKYTFCYSIDSDVAESEEASNWQKEQQQIPFHLLTKHCHIDETLVPTDEKTNVIIYNDVTSYDWERNLYLRNGAAYNDGKYYTTDEDGTEAWIDARIFHPSDFTTIDEIPPHLRVCWEFFKMCERFLREFYEEEVKEEREEEENSEFLEATSLGGCGGM